MKVWFEMDEYKHELLKVWFHYDSHYSEDIRQELDYSNLNKLNENQLNQFKELLKRYIKIVDSAIVINSQMKDLNNG